MEAIIGSMDWTIIGVGCAGGAIPDVIRIIKGRYELTLPAYLKTINFWLGLILMVILGGLAAWLGAATEVKEALAYGYGGPELITKLLATGPTERRGGVSEIRTWWAF